jgi:superoxide reductase
MTEIGQIWKCEVCGNIVEILHSGADSLVCCGQPMGLTSMKVEEEGVEKHKPVISGKKVTVGSIPHPMEEKHYIEWIEVTGGDGRICRVFLKPGENPEAEFDFEPREARAYCNVHGLWKGE